MCIVFLSFRCHPGTKLVICVNRDEFFKRETQSTRYWESPDDNILGARDLKKMGTQFAVTKSGRFAVITSFRSFPEIMDKESRGMVALNFLRSKASPGEYLTELAQHWDNYDGFNILVGTPDDVWYFSNRNGQPPRPQKLEPGRIYGISNAFLDSPWPKVVTFSLHCHRCHQLWTLGYDNTVV